MGNHIDNKPLCLYHQFSILIKANKQKSKSKVKSSTNSILPRKEKQTIRSIYMDLHLELSFTEYCSWKRKAMESASKQVMQKQKLEVPDILKEAVMIYFKNLNFIIFTFLTSLPLFCFMIYFEINLQETLVETSKTISLAPCEFNYYGYCGFKRDFVIDRFNNDYFLRLLQLGFIYLVPLHVSELASAIVTIDLASKLHSESEEKKISLKEMFQKPIDLSNLRGTFITSIYVLFLSTSQLLGLLWIVINYLVFLKDLSFYFLFAAICSIAFAKILRLYLEWSAMCNMSIVISILEGIHGVDALALSAYFSRGSHRRGLFLMLIFFAWGHLLRLSSIHIGGYEERNGVIIQVALFCLVNPLKWVVCMIYLQDCKQRNLEKKIDEELGENVKVVHE